MVTVNRSPDLYPPLTAGAVAAGAVSASGGQVWASADAWLDSVHSCCLCMLDRAGIIRHWNSGAERLTGHPAQRMLGTHHLAMLDVDEARSMAGVQWAAAVRDGQPWRARLAVLCADAVPIPLDVSAEPLRDPDGALLGCMTVLHPADTVTPAQTWEDAAPQAAERSALAQHAEQEILRAHTFGEPLSLIVVGIDDHPRLLAQHGAATAAQAVTAGIAAAHPHLRRIDILGRLDDTRFALLLPRANKEPAAELARQLCRQIGELRIERATALRQGQRRLNITASLGVAALRPGQRSFADLLRGAQQAQRIAQRAGGNRVELWFE